MIKSGIVKRKPQELFEGNSVLDLGFQFRIGVDLEPLLEKKAFHQEKRRIGIIVFKAFTNRVVSHKKAFNSGPVHSNVEILHSFDNPVLFHRVKKRDIGKGEVGLHVLEAHDPTSNLL